jgi:hypothetical protein
MCLTTGRSLASEHPHIFDLPVVQAVQAVDHMLIDRAMAKGDYDSAVEVCRRAIDRIPHDAVAHYKLACALARKENIDGALASLRAAVEFGYRDRRRIEQDSDLIILGNKDEFHEILELAKQVFLEESGGWRYPLEPAIAANGQVHISERNVAWRPKLGVFQVHVRIDGERDAPVAVGLGAVGDLLRRWHNEGTAAGNAGDLYDNHDADHSQLGIAKLPQFTGVEFSDEAKRRQLHHGLQRFFLYNAVTIGNSSTAVVSKLLWRSQGRLALTQPGDAARLYLQYRTNHLYFYPEHRDHDPERGDLFPANTPYLILSQGSSGSDRPFMEAVAQTLAAFHPEVKRTLAKSGLLMPTVQMIFRISNNQISSAKDYLSGRAHPAVFNSSRLDVLKMVTMAHDMRPSVLPPLAQVKVVDEDEGAPGRDYFAAEPGERLFDTPCAICRVVRSLKYDRRMVVSAEESRDLHNRPLTYHWVVLRGDAERIRITPLNDAGSIVELVVPYHGRFPIADDRQRDSIRVDIGAFVNNGAYYSPPAFISLCYPQGEQRTYDEQHRIQAVDYAAPAREGRYIDPVWELLKDWRDEYRYGDDGRLLGWTRIRGADREEFTPEGRLVLARDELGQPQRTIAVRYLSVQRTTSDPPELLQQLVPGSEQ